MKFQIYPYSAVLGWSSSRYQLFSSCKRRYYYHYYNKYDQDFKLKRIQKLKNLTSIPLETGKIVHEIIETLLMRFGKLNSAIDLKRFNQYVNKSILQSCKRQYFIELHKSFCSNIELENFSPKVQTATQNFLKSSRFEELKEKAFQNDNFVVEPAGYGESRLDGLKIYAKMDCLYQDQDKLTIIDWKTGKERTEEHNNQLLAYCAAAQNCLENPPARIEAVAAYTYPSYKEKMLTPSPEQIKAFADEIRTQTEEMYSYCKDIPNNIPLPKASFPKLNHGAFCKHCNFEELCV